MGLAHVIRGEPHPRYRRGGPVRRYGYGGDVEGGADQGVGGTDPATGTTAGGQGPGGDYAGPGSGQNSPSEGGPGHGGQSGASGGGGGGNKGGDAYSGAGGQDSPSESGPGPGGSVGGGSQAGSGGGGEGGGNQSGSLGDRSDGSGFASPTGGSLSEGNFATPGFGNVSGDFNQSFNNAFNGYNASEFTGGYFGGPSMSALGFDTNLSDGIAAQIAGNLLGGQAGTIGMSPLGGTMADFSPAVPGALSPELNEGRMFANDVPALPYDTITPSGFSLPAGALAQTPIALDTLQPAVFEKEPPMPPRHPDKVAAAKIAMAESYPRYYETVIHPLANRAAINYRGFGPTIMDQIKAKSQFSGYQSPKDRRGRGVTPEGMPGRVNSNWSRAERAARNETPQFQEAYKAANAVLTGAVQDPWQGALSYATNANRNARAAAARGDVVGRAGGQSFFDASPRAVEARNTLNNSDGWNDQSWSE